MDKSVKQLRRFYFEQFDLYFHYLRKINEKQKKRELHKARLSIKNIRALHYFLANVAIDKTPIEILEKQIKKIYKPLGKIRECQINSSFAKKNLLNYQAQRAYLTFLKTQMDGHSASFKKKISKTEIGLNSALLSQIKQVLPKKDELDWTPKLHNYILGKVESVRQLLNNLTTEQQIHKIRKNLKLIKSVLLIGKISRLTNSIILKKELTKVENEIGNWHDSIEFRDSLIEFIKKNQEFDTMVRINLELIEADSLMFQNQLPDLINPLLLELRKGLEKKEPV